MNNYRLMLLVVVAAAISTVQAGTSAPYEVTVEPNSAWGTIVGARTSTGGVQNIGCQSFGDVAICTATNASGVYKYCTTANPVHLAAIGMIAPNSFIQFDWDKAAQCTFVSVANDSSFFLP